MADLYTTRGALGLDDLGTILPHEHIFVNLNAIESDAHEHANPEDVVAVMAPYVESAMEAGVTALVECTPVGVGRRPDVDQAVSDATGLPVVLPTGIYREPWVPEWAHEASEAELTEWMVSELTEPLEGCETPAAWIKLSASDDGLTQVETKILRAAGAAAAETGAVVGSHTVSGEVVREQLDVLETVGHAPERFVWIHTQAEEDVDAHLEAARRGAWIEYDWIGHEGWSDEYFVERVGEVLDAGLEDRLLLSQDRGWYDPSEPGGGEQRPYTHLCESLLPKLRSAGISEETVSALTRENPFRAFAR
jgi:phosphotriesterase-related protein